VCFTGEFRAQAQFIGQGHRSNVGSAHRSIAVHVPAPFEVLGHESGNLEEFGLELKNAMDWQNKERRRG